MANLGGLLGTMLATGMGGRSRRGPIFASGTRTPAVRGGGGFGQMAGLASLGYLAYKAYQERQGNQPAAGGDATMRPHARAAAGGQPSLGDRMAEALSRGPGGNTPEPQIGDQKALLLVRAMVAAANADGEIDQQERGRILKALADAGAGDDDRRILERELDRPASMDDIVAGARDPETAEQVYLASELAIEPDGRAEQSYLRYLADRLNLPQDRVEELRRIA